MSRRLLVLAVATLVIGTLVPATPATAARDRKAPTTPADLRITASTGTSVSLQWDASTDSSNFWYCVQRNGGGCVRVDPPRTTVTFTKLLPDRTHTFSVYAVDIAGNRSANSNTVSHETPPDTTPPSPAPTISVTSVAPTTISIAWTQAVDDISQVWTTLFVNGSPYFVDDLRPPNATLYGLDPESTYEFQVSVRDAYGNAVTGEVLAVTTPAVTDTQPPTAPADLTASQRHDPEIPLFWTQSTDDTDPQSAIRYQVVQDGVVQGHAVGQGRTTIYCLELGITEIFVRAIDTSGNVSAASNTVTSDCTEVA
jgi:chitodextrinase